MGYEQNPYPTRGSSKAKSGIVRDMMGDVNDARRPVNNDRMVNYSISAKTSPLSKGQKPGKCGDILGSDYKTGGSIQRD